MTDETAAVRTSSALPTLRKAERRVGRALLADYPSAGLASAARLLQQARPQNETAVETLAAPPTSALEAPVALLSDSGRGIYLHGGRFSHLLAVHLAAHLEQLRPGVRLLTDPDGTDMGAMLELSRTDVVVLFDYHRYQRSAADLALRAHRAGATVLLITDDLACPVAPEAEAVLTASSTIGTTYQSMAAGFLLTELLIPLVMDTLGEPARTRKARWEEQRRAELLP